MRMPSRLVVVVVVAQCTLHYLVCGSLSTRGGKCCREQIPANKGSGLGTTSLGLPEEMLVNEKGHLWDNVSAATATAIAQAPDSSRQHQVRAGRSALPADCVFRSAEDLAIQA